MNIIKIPIMTITMILLTIILNKKMNLFLKNDNNKMSKINAIVCVVKYKNKLAIGRDNTVLLKLKEDLDNFKTLTKDKIVVMGRKTWFSLPRESRPLKNRINIILTRDKNLHKLSPFPFYMYFGYKKLNKTSYFMTFAQFEIFQKLINLDVYIIGGSEIYELFINHPLLHPKTVYITEVIDYNIPENREPTTFFKPLPLYYKLEEYSEIIHDGGYNVNYRFLTYNYNKQNMLTHDDKYLELCRDILKKGVKKDDRTNTGTLSLFGTQLTFDISETVPLLTTKNVPWKIVIEELLWFLRGDSDAKILQEKGVKIWDGNSSREFLDSRGLYNYDEGVLGPMYGWNFRFFGAPYSQALSDTSTCDTRKIGGFDQLDYVINEIKNNPSSRRILISLWNPLDFKKVSLMCCHYSLQFNVRTENNTNYLDCIFNMRSSDVFLGLPFNIFSYTVLTYIIAKKCNMLPGKLVYNGGDTHIYNTHTSQIHTQLNREPLTSPKLLLDDSIITKDFKDITIDDFKLIGYFSHPTIKAQMAI